MTTAISFPYKGRQLQLSCPTVHLLYASMRQFLTPVLSDLYTELTPIEDGVLLDIGGNIGWMAVFFALTFPKVQVHSVEASTFNYAYLEHTAKSFSNIMPHHFAASDTGGKIHIAVPDIEQRPGIKFTRDMCGVPNSGHVSVYGKSNTFAETVTAKRLDDVFERADFIKIDVEGYTLPVLKGAERLVRENRPYLQLETNKSSYAMADYTVEDLDDWLFTRGYEESCSTGPIHDRLVFPKEKVPDALRRRNR